MPLDNPLFRLPANHDVEGQHKGLEVRFNDPQTPGKFTLQTGEVLDSLRLILEDARPSRVYFAKPFRQGQKDVKPDCFSRDGLVPDPSVESPPSNACIAIEGGEIKLVCPKAQFNGGRSPCAEQLELLGYLESEGGERGERVRVLLKRASASAVKYFLSSLHAKGIDPSSGVIELYAQENSRGYVNAAARWHRRGR